jgi:8-hydroxy-5-deazaflavin:NADPH oxidoreductase
MTTIGFIGSGHIGGTVARLSVAAGQHVILSNSRGPDTLAELAAELGPLARAGTGPQAAAADLVVVAIPFGVSLAALLDDPLAGKTILDAGNYYPERDGRVARLDDHSATSSGLFQEHLAQAKVVKVFNNIFYKHLHALARPAGAADRSYLPIAGDDPAARAAVSEWLDAIGYGAVDAGPLADSWRQEPGTPVYGKPYGPFDDEHGHPASAEVIAAALAAATR